MIIQSSHARSRAYLFHWSCELACVYLTITYIIRQNTRYSYGVHEAMFSLRLKTKILNKYHFQAQRKHSRNAHQKGIFLIINIMLNGAQASRFGQRK